MNTENPAPNRAEVYARATGSVSATYTVERRNTDGTLTIESTEEWSQPVTVPAAQVRPGQRVLIDGAVYFVRHVMTTGKKARTTSIDVWGHDPFHFAPTEPVRLS